jgi:hypothetical protein
MLLIPLEVVEQYMRSSQTSWWLMKHQLATTLVLCLLLPPFLHDRKVECLLEQQKGVAKDI